MQFTSTFNFAHCKPREHVSTQISRTFLSISIAIATAVHRPPDPTHSHKHNGATPTLWTPTNHVSSAVTTHYYRGSFSYFSLTCPYVPNRFCPALVIYLTVPSSNIHPVISHEMKHSTQARKYKTPPPLRCVI